MLSTVIAALYGRSDNKSLSRIARPSQIISCLRKKADGQTSADWAEAMEALKSDGFTQEALFLSDGANIESALHLLAEGRIITLGCEMYPSMLISTLGNNAPPILWISDSSLRTCQPWNNNDGSQRISVGGVGCRTPLSIGLAVASEVGLWTAGKGFLAVTGGAIGCDTAYGRAAFGAGGEVIHILPHGIDFMSPELWGFGVSVCPPREPFSPGRAMERNALIYALSHMTVVCSARYRQGGSWQGAATALKAHRPVVVADWTSTGVATTMPEHVNGTYAQAQRTMANLGAQPLLLDVSRFRTDLAQELDKALDWSLDRLAGNMNTGLFSA